MLVIGVLTGGCRKTHPEPESVRKVALSLPLFHVAGVDSPLISVEVNNRPTRMLVDTGATFHALVRPFAEGIGAVSTAPSARDHVGAIVATGEISDISITASSQTLFRRGNVAVVPSNPITAALAIGGYFSPQVLGPAGFTEILDLRHDRLAVLSGALGEADRTGSGGSLAPKGLRTCREGAGRRYIVDARLAGTAIALEIDTGSAETHVFERVPVGQMLVRHSEPAEAHRSVAGEYSARRAKSVAFDAGEVHRTVDVLVIDGISQADCPVDGMLGMDVLKDCVIALDETTGLVRCDPPR